MSRLFRRTAPTGTVLYDAPGPRARITTWIVSVVVLVAIVAALYYLVYLPLDEKGQFAGTLWGPMLDPSHTKCRGVPGNCFDQVWQRIGAGLQATLIAAALAIVSSLVIGTLLAILRLQLQAMRQRRYVGFAPPVAVAFRTLTWILNAVTRFCVEIFRGMPVVVTIFFVARGLPEFGLDFDTLWFLVIGLTIYNGVVIGEILRSGMTGLASGQREAAVAIGLSPFQTTTLILLPQAYRIMLPALISQVVVVLKDTSLGFLIGYQDTLTIARQIINVLNNSFQLYIVIGVIFIIVNYALSKLAQYVQRRLARAPRTAGLPPVAAPAASLFAQDTLGTATPAADPHPTSA
jgi:glutamate transport system permease protein